MTLKEFVPLMDELQDAFMRSDARHGNDMYYKTWYNAFAYFPKDVFDYAVHEWIFTESRVPYIADLRSICITAMNMKTNDSYEWDMANKRLWQYTVTR